MMIIINLMKPTGVFEYIAIKSAKLGKGEPFQNPGNILQSSLRCLSALLDNVTTVLLIAPVTHPHCRCTRTWTPYPYLIPDALASNIGGTATLIGDPPNIMIASKAQLDFMALHLSPLARNHYCTDGFLHICHKIHMGQEAENKRRAETEDHGRWTKTRRLKTR